MAVTSIWPIKGRVDKVINYARNPEKTHDKEKLSELHEIEGVVEYAADEMKTEKRAYVTCLHLHSEETAAQEFMETKRLMHNEGGRSCYHGYQSFKADEVDADTAHSIGVALARELWGDRFQVVIATHCNTGHYHNHFVINSVSDVDGKKFYNSPADYRRMREVSDRLCREAKISVIEYPADRRANYGEWLAEKNGKPTMRSRIREDIDRAILASTTEREFQRVMKEMGYEVITKTPKGSPRVHPIVRIVDGGKNFRLDKLGEYYELDSIKQRMCLSAQRTPARSTAFSSVSVLPPQTSARRAPKSSRHRRSRRTRTFPSLTATPRKRIRRKHFWMRCLPLRPIRRRHKRKTPRKARLRNPVRPSLHQISARKPSGVSLIQRNAPAHLSGRK